MPLNPSIPAPFKFTIRPITTADIPAAIELFRALEAAEPVGETISAADFAAQLQPAGDFRHNAWLAYLSAADGSEGKAIAYAQLEREPADMLAWGVVQTLPDYRNNGVGSQLCTLLEAQAQSWQSSGVRVTPDHRDQLSHSFFTKRGYVFDHERWRLMLPATVSVPAPALPAGYAFRDFVLGQDEETLRWLIPTAFAGYPDFQESDIDEQLGSTIKPNFRPDSLFFTTNAAGETVGYCLTDIGEDGGWIAVMGVIPEYRHLGLGRAMLLRGIHYLRQFAPDVHIGTEGYNYKALALYEGTGFQRYKGTVHLIKRFAASSN